MLSKLRPASRKQFAGRYAVVASQFNRRYVDSMVRAAVAELKKSRAATISVVRVPGAFEIPVVAGRLARATPPEFDAILCFGVIFRGETTHADHIGQAVSHALAAGQFDSGIPLIHGVYLFENTAQARVRCLNPEHNRGTELGRTAIEMARLMQSLP